MTTNPNATLAALVIFNGYKLSPVLASPDHRLSHIGGRVHPRFEQCAAYCSRFFGPDSTALDFAPYEQLGDTVAVAPWIRGAVGFLQHALNQSEGMDIPNCEDVNPEDWFADLHEMVITYRLAVPAFGVTAAAKVQDLWEESEFVPRDRESHAYKVGNLYGLARAKQIDNELLTDPAAINKARKKVEKSS